MDTAFYVQTEEGFAAEVGKLTGLLFTVSYSLLADRELCGDAVQNALLRAWEKRFTLREESNFKAWLIKIVMNESRNIRRRKGWVELPENLPDKERDTDMRSDVSRAVLKLGEIYRVPIMLFYYEDMKVQEIADVLELPKGTLLSRLSRGRDILRKELRDYGV